MYEEIKVIGFDADDTLWVNETLFRQAESEFFKLLELYDVEHRIYQELFRTEMDNLELYGYGIKGFMLSMIETALKVSDGKISNEAINSIIQIGKRMMNAKVEILDDVKSTLQNLKSKYRLIMVTKGDLSDQERKLNKSNLEEYFHHIEIVSQKKPANYSKLLDHLDISPDEFLMVGNSLRSDILPVLEIGAQAIHIPFHTTWDHEKVSDEETRDKKYYTLTTIREIPNHLESISESNPSLDSSL